MTQRSWVNGVASDTVAITDRSLLFGDSCFTTVAVRAGQPRQWSRHRERLLQTTAQLRFPSLDIAQLEQEVFSACQPVDRAILRITLTRGSGGRGYALPDTVQAQRLLLLRDWPADIEVRGQTGIRVRWCETRLSAQPLLAGLKHGNRLEQVLARAEWQDAQIAEGLMCDDLGQVVEGTTSNLFFRSMDGQWCTPSLQRCGVAGVMRAELLEAFKKAEENVREAAFTPAQLLAATEVFLCNAVIGIWPVVALADRQWLIGERTRQMQHYLERNL